MYALIAIMFLTTPMPPDCKMGLSQFFPINEEDLKPLKVEIQSLALEWEIMDHREARYVMHENGDMSDFYSNLELLRQRYVDLQDAPKLCEHYRFLPDHRAINELLSFNRSYHRWLEANLLMNHDRSGPILEAKKENQYLYDIWDHLRDAKCEYYYITSRRMALKKLRDKLEFEDYFKGEMPPYVPIWRFREE